MAGVLQLKMTRGEITPFLHARIDLDHYRDGLATMINWVPLRYGGMTRFPGTLYQGPTKTHAKRSRILPFLFNRDQKYAIETGDLYFRFWNVTGRIESPPGTPVEVATPYLEADLKYLQWRQVGDQVYLTCSGYWPRILTRASETSWSIALYVPLDGPYLPLNTTAVTLDPSAGSGSVNLTLSAATAVNAGVGWLSGDIGRVVRYFEVGAGRWYWFVITARTSATVAVATYMGRDDGDTAAMGAHAATAIWQVGAWSSTSGYPSAIGLYEDRMTFGGSTTEPTAVWATVPADYDNFVVSAPLVADDALTATLTGGQLNAIQWMVDGDDLLIGTEGSLRVLGRNDESSAFGPLNFRQKPQSSVSTSYIPGFTIESVLLFLDVYRSKLYEALYTNEQQGYVARELSALNEHLLGLEVVAVAYQVMPHSIIWMATDDGQLLAAVYDRANEIFGVSHCNVGPDSYVEDVLTLPGSTKDGDEVWLIVRRTVDGSSVRYVERLSAFYREGVSDQAYPVYAHCAGVYEGTAISTVTGLDYLEAATVGVWADGVDLGDVVVDAGELALPIAFEAETIVWGVRALSTATTLRVPENGLGQPGVGRLVNVSEATIDIYQTLELSVGIGSAEPDPIRFDDDVEHEPYTAAALRTGAAAIKLDSDWASAGACTIETQSMYPATVRAITLYPEAEDD